MRIASLVAFLASVSAAACAVPPLEEEPVAARDAQSIVGGEDAVPGAHPWMGALFYPSDWYGSESPVDRFACGATLIDAERGIVLTAAHCVGLAIESRGGCGQDDNPCEPGEEVIWIPAAFPAEFLHVSIGSYALSEIRPEDLLPVRQVIMHPEYDDFITENDVALLIVDGVDPSTPTPRLAGDRRHDRLLALPGTRASIAGWGRLSTESEEGPDNLQAASLPIIAPALCKHLVESDFLEQVFNETMLCAAPLRGGRGICFGDSGGALTVPDWNGRRVIVGVTSWTPNGECAEPFAPGVFSNVHTLHGWITECLASPEGCPKAIEIPEDQIDG
jgi:secreted trypsin-like serine protease